MDRRIFLKLSGLAAAAGTLRAWPAAAAAGGARWAPIVVGPRVIIREPGTYQITGRVRLESPSVEISGISNTQRITWSGLGSPGLQVVGFTTFERFDGLGLSPAIQVRGGRLEALSVVPLDLE